MDGLALHWNGVGYQINHVTFWEGMSTMDKNCCCPVSVIEGHMLLGSGKIGA